jgi:hypothetical protein
MTSRNWIAAIALITLLLIPFSGVHAQGGDSPEVIFAEEYTLGEGTTIDHNLVVVAQTITLAPGSTVEGDAALLGETITVQGHITGELVMMGDRLELADGSYIEGTVNLCGDTILRGPNAHITGSYYPGCEQIGSLLSEVVPLAFDPSRWEWDGANVNPADWNWSRLSELEDLSPGLSPMERLMLNGVAALFVAAIAGLFTLICPLRLRRVSDAALSAPLVTTGIGVLSFIIAAAVTGLVAISLLLIVTFCLLPFLGLAWVIIAIMLAMGWAALSLPVGAWFLSRLEIQRVSPLAAASVGAFLLTFGTGLFTISLWTLILYVLVGGLLASWGLGAVIMTRFGGQIYPNPAANWANKPKRDVDIDEFTFET